MKKLVLVVVVFALSFAAYAQIETPAPSPFAKIEQKVGLTDVTLEFSRPSVKGRKIFGDLEPFGGVWRTGANKNTMITFSDDVVIAGKEVKAGAYALFTKLNSAKQWDVMFYADTENWGTPREWDASKVVATAKVDVIKLPMTMETFTLNINNISANGASLDIMWETSYVSIPFTVPTDKTVTSAITKVMDGPSANDYYAAADYYLTSGKDANQAKVWMDKAMSKIEKPGFWQIRRQSLIYAAAGDKAGAIRLAKESMAGAKAAGNQNYVKQNMDSLKEWGAL